MSVPLIGDLPYDDPRRITPLQGRLPTDAKEDYDKAKRVDRRDLRKASLFDLCGDSIHLVSSALTTAYQLPDLVLEFASLKGEPLSYTFPNPYSIIGGKPVYDAYLIEDLTALRQFIDSVRFVAAERSFQTFLHAVVVAHPSVDVLPPSDMEQNWVESKLSVAGLKNKGEEVVSIPPAGVILWTVGLEAADKTESVYLKSGYRASVQHDRPNSNRTPE